MPSILCDTPGKATFGKMGTIQPLLRGVPLFSDSNLDLYITLEFAPIHEATNCWPDLDRAIALVIPQPNLTQQVSSKSLIVRQDLIVGATKFYLTTPHSRQAISYPALSSQLSPHTQPWPRQDGSSLS
ncbi:hypothetical protein CFIO01_00700 [Colletotrichum fioriniae PJ7]|uniref:Uncharacterized protein n=1 Tax=Colletotrichum fioriniae PJ7 TaxID=1445577 RepID=A0A010SFK2_9PEZI|nr:hypothetical protein CFIO01_00700 [Colletotrichum fioriniae PJ7]